MAALSSRYSNLTNLRKGITIFCLSFFSLLCSYFCRIISLSFDFFYIYVWIRMYDSMIPKLRSRLTHPKLIRYKSHTFTFVEDGRRELEKYKYKSYTIKLGYNKLDGTVNIFSLYPWHHYNFEGLCSKITQNVYKFCSL